jgi:outer membrane PBP1 activator LpoA protein
MPASMMERQRIREGEGSRAGCRRVPALIFALLVCLVSACTTFEPAVPPEPVPGAGAEEAFARGAYQEAAEAWQREALDAPQTRASSLRVRAADAWLLSGNPADAERLLRWIARSDLGPADQSRLDLVLAELALLRQRPDEAEALLRSARGALPPGSEARYQGLLDRARDQLASPVSRGIANAAQLSGSLRTYDPSVSVDIMRALESVTSGELAIRAENPRAERQLTGWLDLALTIRQNLVVADQVSRAIAEWKVRNPSHLLNESQALDTWLRYRQTFSPPRRIAALLPASGRLAAAGEAARDGLMSAYLAEPGRAELLLFPTGDDTRTAIAAYFSAVDAGADWILGPLQREAVEAMLNLAGLTTPVLALNDFPEGFVPPPGLGGQLSGMSLSQEAEAAAAARHAADSGFERAIVLAPESPWGERLAAAFEAEFLQEDRQIVGAARYLESQNDHSSVLERMLKIDASEARKKRLESTLQMPLEFEPARREDVDVIFLAASSMQAKLIRPQLRFLDAGDIPVYATGRIFSGQPDPAGNQDLDGLRFPALPWQLQHATAESIPDLASLRGGALSALFAIGQDAWNVLPWLDLMRNDGDFAFPGASGSYRMGHDGGLVREPAWAEFRGGVPRALPPPASLSFTSQSRSGRL